jgi:pimeloyl-ACP methyl ester carboxylesterase
LAAAVLTACGGSSVGIQATPGTMVRMEFAHRDDFYAAPFPSDHRLNADGSVDMEAFRNPDKIGFMDITLDIAKHEVKGFGVSAGIFFSLTGPMAAKQPDLFASMKEDAAMFVMSVTREAADYGKRYPIDAHFEADGGPFGAKNQLTLLPLQGTPLRTNTRYAAVVLRSAKDAQGRPLGVSYVMAQLAAGVRPAGLDAKAFAEYREALAALREAGVAASSIAGMTVFTTGDPTAELKLFLADALARPLPQIEAPFVAREVFDNFCVYDTTIRMPVYQDGVPPFSEEGGGWSVDKNGKPLLQGTELSHFVVTVPRAPMPAKGYPAVYFIRTGGGDRPLVERGFQPVNHGPSATAGTGPALEFAKAGFGGATIDGPHGGLRNVTHGDEQVLMFNVLNPRAMRDNTRQTALETDLAAHILGTLTIDAANCPGAAPAAKFDTSLLVLMGHSMGATVAQPALAFEPLYKAVILSGSGASWIENLLYKKKPLDVKPVAELILNYGKYNRELTRFDPAVSMTQWVGEESDAQAYNRLTAGGPQHVLMLQGIVDHYIMPSIAAAGSLSLGLDHGGAPLDEATPEIAAFHPLRALLPFSGRSIIGLPAAGNRAGVTAVVVQHREDGIEDGHEVAFQTRAPKEQYRCFLEGLAAGKVPAVPAIPAPASCR